MTKKSKVLSFTVGICLLGLLISGGSAIAANKNVPIPKMMTWMSYEVGSALYMAVGFVSTTLYEKYGIKIRTVPAGADIPRVYPIRLKDAEVAFHGIGAYYMQEGTDDYSSMEWGPQPIRVLYYGQHAGLPLAVRKDSSIQTVNDLKGKKLAAFPTRSLTTFCELSLAFAGLNWDQVVKVNVPSYSAAIRMVMEGKIDATILNPTAPLAYEFEAMQYGLRYLPLPFNNKDGWARMKKHTPWIVPLKTSIGAGLSEGKPLETLSYPYPAVIAYDFLSDEKAYIITKLLVESYPDYAKKNKSLEAFWKPDSALQLFDSFPLPMHRGSIQYFQETGKWTSARNMKNDERIQHQDKLRKLWETTREEGLAKQIKSNEFPQFWAKKRAEAGF